MVFNFIWKKFDVDRGALCFIENLLSLKQKLEHSVAICGFNKRLEIDIVKYFNTLLRMDYIYYQT